MEDTLPPKFTRKKRERDPKEILNRELLEDEKETSKEGEEKQATKLIEVCSVESELALIQNDKTHWDRIRTENINEILVTNKEFIFGNYNRYYYKRFLDSLKDPDPRLSILKDEWIKGKKCLDIGCNDGTVAITIAVYHSPSLIEGIDIDYRLIKKCVKNMKHVMRSNLSKRLIENMMGNKSGNEMIRIEPEEDEIKEKSSKLKDIIDRMNTIPKSFLINLGYPLKNNLLTKAENLSQIKIDNKDECIFPHNLIFRQENYVAQLQQEIKYDVILCLSTVKWIHLNYGDTGVKILFYNIYHQLNDNGLLIFEPQNWKSYKKRSKLTKRIKKNFKAIKLRPEHMLSYLKNIYGFELIHTAVPPPNSKKSFTRLIYILKKKV